MSAQMVPQVPTAEKSALAMMSCNQSLVGSMPWTEDLFFNPVHKLIFGAIQSAAEAQEPGDLIAITSRMEAEGTLDAVGGAAGLTDILMTINATLPDQAVYYFAQLTKARAYRGAIESIEASLPDLRTMTVPIGDVVEQIGAAADSAGQRQRETLAKQMDAVYAELQRREKPECLSTGLPTLDRHLAGGLHRKEFAVVAAETSGGKSVLLGMSALSVAQEGKPVAMFSLEMPAAELLKRMASNLAGVRVKSVFEHPSKGEMLRMSRALSALGSLPLTIVDDMTTLAEIEAEGRRLARLGKANLIVIDYLQLIEHSQTDSREQAVSETARRLKNLALTADAAVFSASQLNEQGQLRESRAIGHHSDQVFLVGDGEIRIAKNRRGPRDVSAKVTLRGELGRFEEEAVQ